jgi:hypothetical protein
MLRRRNVTIILGVAVLAAVASCGPRAATDLEILSVAPAAGSAPAPGATLALEAQVRNNGRDAATVAAAVAGGADMGLLRRGPEREIRRGRTEVLTLDVPAERTFLRGCEFVATVFLVRPGDPPNVFRDLWLDPVPENNSREVRAALARPVPAELRVTEPIQEVVESMDARTLRRHYEADVEVLPEGSAWAVRGWVIQTQTALGEPVEVLTATVTGGRLRSGSVIWDGAAARRDSVARAAIRVEYQDCEGRTLYLLGERFAVRLAPRQ